MPLISPTAALMPLVPLPNGRGRDTLGAVDGLWNYLWTIFCEGDRAASGKKISLARDLEMGVEALMNPAATDTATGAVVPECVAVSLVLRT